MQTQLLEIDLLLRGAAKPEYANDLYEYFCEQCAKNGIKVEKGIFGAQMEISLINDGPVTIILEK